MAENIAPNRQLLELTTAAVAEQEKLNSSSSSDSDTNDDVPEPTADVNLMLREIPAFLLFGSLRYARFNRQFFWVLNDIGALLNQSCPRKTAGRVKTGTKIYLHEQTGEGARPKYLSLCTEAVLAYLAIGRNHGGSRRTLAEFFTRVLAENALPATVPPFLYPTAPVRRTNAAVKRTLEEVGGNNKRRRVTVVPAPAAEPMPALQPIAAPPAEEKEKEAPPAEPAWGPDWELIELGPELNMPEKYEFKCPKCGTRFVGRRRGIPYDRSTAVWPPIFTVKCIIPICGHTFTYREPATSPSTSPTNPHAGPTSSEMFRRVRFASPVVAAAAAAATTHVVARLGVCT